MSHGKSRSAAPSATPPAAPVAAPPSANQGTGNDASHSVGSHGPSSEAITQRAHEKFVERGSEHGLDQQDWIVAERELTAESRSS